MNVYEFFSINSGSMMKGKDELMLIWKIQQKIIIMRKKGHILV